MPLLLEAALHVGQDDLVGAAALKNQDRSSPSAAFLPTVSAVPRRVAGAGGRPLSRAGAAAGIRAAGPARGPG